MAFFIQVNDTKYFARTAVQNGTSWRTVSDFVIVEYDDGYYHEHSLAISGDGLVLAVGLPSCGSFLPSYTSSSSKGCTLIMDWDGGNWVYRNFIDFEGPHGYDYGLDVALSSDGHILAVAYQRDFVDVWIKNDNFWIQLGRTIPGPGFNHEFVQYLSISLSSDGRVLALGTVMDVNADPGEMFVYQYKGAEKDWEQLGEDLVGRPETFDMFGSSVALSSNGRVLAVGATEEHIFQGYVQLFWLGSSEKWWEPLGSRIDGFQGDAGFGNTVSLSADGRVLAVQASTQESNKGKVRVVRLNATMQEWVLVGEQMEGPENGSYFGMGLALSADGTRVTGIANQWLSFEAGGYYTEAYVQMYQAVGNNLACRGDRLSAIFLSFYMRGFTPTRF